MKFKYLNIFYIICVFLFFEKYFLKKNINNYISCSLLKLKSSYTINKREKSKKCNIFQNLFPKKSCKSSSVTLLSNKKNESPKFNRSNLRFDKDDYSNIDQNKNNLESKNYLDDSSKESSQNSLLRFENNLKKYSVLDNDKFEKNSLQEPNLILDNQSFQKESLKETSLKLDNELEDSLQELNVRLNENELKDNSLNRPFSLLNKNELKENSSLESLSSLNENELKEKSPSGSLSSLNENELKEKSPSGSLSSLNENELKEKSPSGSLSSLNENELKEKSPSESLSSLNENELKENSSLESLLSTNENELKEKSSLESLSSLNENELKQSSSSKLPFLLNKNELKENSSLESLLSTNENELKQSSLNESPSLLNENELKEKSPIKSLLSLNENELKKISLNKSPSLLNENNSKSESKKESSLFKEKNNETSSLLLNKDSNQVKNKIRKKTNKKNQDALLISELEKLINSGKLKFIFENKRRESIIKLLPIDLLLKLIDNMLIENIGNLNIITNNQLINSKVEKILQNTKFNNEFILKLNEELRILKTEALVIYNNKHESYCLLPSTIKIAKQSLNTYLNLIKAEKEYQELFTPSGSKRVILNDAQKIYNNLKMSKLKFRQNVNLFLDCYMILFLKYYINDLLKEENTISKTKENCSLKKLLNLNYYLLLLNSLLDFYNLMIEDELKKLKNYDLLKDKNSLKENEKKELNKMNEFLEKTQELEDYLKVMQELKNALKEKIKSCWLFLESNQ